MNTSIGIEETTIQSRIEAYLQHPDKKVRKLGQRLCHMIGLKYYVLVYHYVIMRGGASMMTFHKKALKWSVYEVDPSKPPYYSHTLVCIEPTKHKSVL